MLVQTLLNMILLGILLLLPLGSLSLEVHFGPPSHIRRPNDEVVSIHRPRPSPDLLETAVPDEHVFAYNQKLDISWQDPSLLAKLYADVETPSNRRPQTRQESGNRDVRTLSKRGTTVYGPMITQKCLGCIEKDRGIVRSLADLDDEFITKQINQSEAAVLDKCVFYTGVKDQDLDPWENQWVKQQPDMRLSLKATQQACHYGKNTIWTLFPGRDAKNAPHKVDSPDVYNMFEVFEPGSWLYFLHDTKDRFIYFERMSRVMARVCRGIAIVMTLDPPGIQNYGKGTEDENNAHSIWNSAELPELRENPYIKEVWVVRPDNPTKGWPLKMETGEIESGPAIQLPHMPASKLRRRDLCLDNWNTVYEVRGEDWFGAGGQVWR